MPERVPAWCSCPQGLLLGQTLAAIEQVGFAPWCQSGWPGQIVGSGGLLSMYPTYSSVVLICLSPCWTAECTFVGMLYRHVTEQASNIFWGRRQPACRQCGSLCTTQQLVLPLHTRTPGCAS